MAFKGEYEHTIDAKQRLAIPSEIRSKMDPDRDGEGWVVAPGIDGAICWLWPDRAFEERADRFLSTLAQSEDQLEFIRLYFSRSKDLEVDKAGRVRLPEWLAKDLAPGTALMVLGVRDHLEVYLPAVWQEMLEKRMPNLKEIMLRAQRTMGSTPGA